MRTLENIRRSGNILYLIYKDDVENKNVEETYILKNSVIINTYDDLYSYYPEREIESGEYAIFLIIDEKYASWDDRNNALSKHSILFYVGDDEISIKKKLKPYLAKKKNVNKKLKIIDFFIMGSQMKLYLGKPETNDYWGDDWNDAPYEHNAGTVYERYVEDTVTINFLNEELVEICDGYLNSPFSKEDFIKGEPFAYLANDEEENCSFHKICRNNIFNNNKIKKFYFNTPIGEFYKAGYLITD